MFNSRKSPVGYLEQTKQYITDIARVTTLRNQCEDPKERADYDTTIHVMQEVLIYMNSLSKKERLKIITPQKQETSLL